MEISVNQRLKSKKINHEIKIFGARENNLKDINVNIPHHKLVVITGLSGSGKSSLAFNTIFAESQRRYIETFSAYARQFIGQLERPDVDEISGLSPAVSIEQKSVNKNPRSTVGTITEIYDFLRLLYARVSTPYSYITGRPMIKLTENQILERITKEFGDATIHILSPIVKGRKGHYRELFETFRKKGFLKVRIDSKITELTYNLKVDRYKIHDIEILIDTLKVQETSIKRLRNSIETAIKNGKEQCLIINTDTNEGRFYSKNLMCEESGIAYNIPESNMFSYNSPYGACPKCNGIGSINIIDTDKIFPDKNSSIREGGIAPFGKYKNNWLFNTLDTMLKKEGYSISTRIKDLPDNVIAQILYGSQESYFVMNYELGISSGIPLTYEGVNEYILQQQSDGYSNKMKKWANSFTLRKKCQECGGARLKKESLYFLINNKNISQVSDLQINELADWIVNIDKEMSESHKLIASTIIKEIKHRVNFLLDIGLDYLTLSRQAPTLSSGESQRIRLATQIASNLVDVLYILDEPSIGLHQRDNRRLVKSLKQLRDKGNSIIVVEHDENIIKSSDYIIDIGPGAGKKGGYVVASGNIEALKNQNSLTIEYIFGRKNISYPKNRRMANKQESITIVGATGHNLKSLNITIPLGLFISVTGVSGSGKSSIINQTLYPILNKHIYRSNNESLPYHSVLGLEKINKVIEVNQDPIGRTPRSNPATYSGVFDSMRLLYSETMQSKIRGYKPGYFSFNVKGGRCETCKGAGVMSIEMGILPNVEVQCSECNGKRYNKETLEIRYKGKSIFDVLNMTIDSACDFFQDHPKIISILKKLREVGLGYLTLGQSSTTLSGGENQRLKLATELAKKDTGKTIYMLDEPTTGLHFEDINVLLKILHSLVDKGNTVIIIEHNLDVIKNADYIIDLGPEGGVKGGEIIAEGTPEEVSESKKSYTGKFLREVLY